MKISTEDTVSVFVQEIVDRSEVTFAFSHSHSLSQWSIFDLFFVAAFPTIEEVKPKGNRGTKYFLLLLWKPDHHCCFTKIAL